MIGREIDLRSDTVTKPTLDMQVAMQKAPVGDDVYGEDPTINKLQEMAANMFGHEAALFCPSGTMTNQIAIRTHTKPGEEVICYNYAHIYNYEGGGMALNSSVQPSLIPAHRGVFSPSDVASRIRPDNEHFPKTGLVALENTCNKAGGTCWDFDQMKSISDLCQEKNLAIHLDGARVFNAIVAKGYSPKEIGKLFSSISICLSKGLGAPVGSLLLGSKSFIKQAHRYRKAMGGGMRQAGSLAAAGIYALENHIERLQEDHNLAQLLYQGIKDLEFIDQIDEPETNLVLLKLNDGYNDTAFLNKLSEFGVKVGTMAPGLVRFATHLDVNENDIQRVVEILKTEIYDLA